MGKGDQRSKRGKIIVGTYGVKRKKKEVKVIHTPAEKASKAIEPPKKVKTVEEPATIITDETIATHTDEPKAKTVKKKATVKSKTDSEVVPPTETPAPSAE